MKEDTSAIKPATRMLILAVRISLAAGFISAVCDRLGWWGPAGAPHVAWGNWPAFLAYTERLLWFLPKWLIAPMGIISTALEALLGLGLLCGIQLRITAWLSAGLLLSFALAMTAAIGVKAPLDYSVFAAASAAALLAERIGSEATRSRLSERSISAPSQAKS